MTVFAVGNELAARGDAKLAKAQVLNPKLTQSVASGLGLWSGLYGPRKPKLLEYMIINCYVYLASTKIRCIV